MLARRLGWRTPVPLLTGFAAHPTLRAGGHAKRTRPGEGTWPLIATQAYGLAAASAIDLAADLTRRAGPLTTLAPKLRAKGAAAVVDGLLTDDCLAPSVRIGTDVRSWLAPDLRPPGRRGRGARAHRPAGLPALWALTMATAPPPTIDTELEDLPTSMRWREWMGRVEAVIFASPEPVGRAVLARVVGRDCNLDRLIADIAAELTGRPYELVAVAGGWQHRTKPAFAGVIQASGALGTPGPALSQGELTILMAIA